MGAPRTPPSLSVLTSLLLIQRIPKLLRGVVIKRSRVILGVSGTKLRVAWQRWSLFVSMYDLFDWEQGRGLGSRETNCTDASVASHI